LTGYDAAGNVVFEQTTALDRYWDGETPVIDENSFRSARGIVRLQGKLYGSRSELIQEFENTYGLGGEYLAGEQTDHPVKYDA
jgi:hypothetical protein